MRKSASPKRTKLIEETLVIYRSDEDHCWIAHGLRTDQIGTGDTVLSALEDAIRAVNQVFMIAHDDPTVAYLREAPPEILRIAAKARPLPREIYEIAHRRVYGHWPEGVDVDVHPADNATFKTEIREEASV